MKFTEIVKRSALGTLLGASMLVAASPAFGQGTVTVYGEGTYNDTQLVVSLYADITGTPGTDNLVSAGLSLHYDPAQLTPVAADKDENIWYMGDPDTAATYGYFMPMSHVTSYTDPGTGHPMAYIPIMCGKLDTRAGHALDGVAPGTHIPLGQVTFTYPAGSAMPATPATLTIKHIKPDGDGSFKSFVTVGQVVLDDTPGAVTYGMVAMNEETPPCPGDANGDGHVNFTDFSTLKSQWGHNGAGLTADFNQDGHVNFTDFGILKANWGNTCP